MTAQVGDRLQFRTCRLDQPVQVATVLEVGAGGDRPYRRRFTDGAEKLVFAGRQGVDVAGDTKGGGV